MAKRRTKVPPDLIDDAGLGTENMPWTGHEATPDKILPGLLKKCSAALQLPDPSEDDEAFDEFTWRVAEVVCQYLNFGRDSREGLRRLRDAIANLRPPTLYESLWGQLPQRAIARIESHLVGGRPRADGRETLVQDLAAAFHAASTHGHDSLRERGVYRDRIILFIREVAAFAGVDDLPDDARLRRWMPAEHAWPKGRVSDKKKRR